MENEADLSHAMPCVDNLYQDIKYSMSLQMTGTFER